ncbi:MFS transporter [Oceanicella sp. SM1341]|uniref:MFS transporter n=1 Tax=Oceanicella sp. SM1341 TaxID=1548889 RepID=UPI000E5535A4|nr:MFS transporter [Oceanicella sp. SM1341]
MSSLQDTAAAPAENRAALAFHAGTLFTFYAASAAPTPLYRLYQELWGLSPMVVTLVFAVYAFSLLAALLVVGSISDHVGRRPAIAVALVLQAGAMLLFTVAEDASLLLAARVAQGLATGAAASAIGAALVDVSRSRGPLVNALSPMLGMSTGALLAGVLVTWAPAPLRLVYLVLLGLNLVQLALLLTRVPETMGRRPGALDALWPRVRVPAGLGRLLLGVTPVNVAVWSLGGIFLSIIPTLVSRVTGITSPLLGAGVVVLLTLSAATSVLANRGRDPMRVIASGVACLLPGLLILVLAVRTGNVALLLLAPVIGGFGFGSIFQGSLNSLLPLASPEQRAELLSIFYVECYLSMSVPAIAAGALASRIGIVATVEIFAIASAALAAGGFLALRAGNRRRRCTG